MDITYDIIQFIWKKVDNSFYANEESLYPEGDYKCSFPNGRKKFYIKNNKTKGFRRFILHKESDTVMQFISEDGILCNIQKKKND